MGLGFRSLFNFMLVLYAVILIGFSQHLFVADSEFWSWSVGYSLSRFSSELWIWDRPVFHSLLYGLSFFSKDVWQSLLLVRGAAALWCCGVLLISSLLVFELSKKRSLALLAPMLLMANSTFVSQAYRVRSDMLAVFFLLVAIYLYLRGRPRWSGLAACLCLFTTPKAVVFALPALFFFAIRTKRWRRPTFILATITLMAFFGVGALQRHWTYLNEALWQFDYRGQFLLSYWQLKENWWFWLLLVLIIGTLSNLQRHRWSLLVLSYYVFLLFFYPDMTQFFVAALLPLIVILFCILALEFFSQRRWGLQVVMVLAFISSLWSPLYWYLRNDQRPKLSQQVDFLRGLDEFMDKHQFTSVLDGIGALPLRMHSPIYLGPKQTTHNQNMFSVISSEPPDVILMTNRLTYLGATIQEFVARYYYEVSPGIFFRMIFLNEKFCQFSYQRPNLLQWMAYHRFRVTPESKFKFRRFNEVGGLIGRGERTTAQILGAPPEVLHCHEYKYWPVTGLFPQAGPFNVLDLFHVDM